MKTIAYQEPTQIEIKKITYPYESLEVFIKYSCDVEPLLEQELKQISNNIQKSAKEIRKLIFSSPYAARAILKIAGSRELGLKSKLGMLNKYRDLKKVLDKIDGSYTSSSESVSNQDRLAMYKIIRKINPSMRVIRKIFHEMSEYSKKNSIEDLFLEKRRYTNERLEKAWANFREYDQGIDKIVRSNMRLIPFVAKNLKCDISKLADVYSMLSLKLAKAAGGYRAHKGYAFSTYATNILKKSLTEGLDKSIEETILDEPLRISETTILTRKDLLTDENTPSAPEEISQKQTFKMCRIYYLQATRALSRKEKYVFESLFGLKGQTAKSEEEIAKKLGVTRQAINVQKHRIINKIRRYFLPLKDSI
jgi:RNA polymerase sigma factor (sigma-70 family)